MGSLGGRRVFWVLWVVWVDGVVGLIGWSGWGGWDVWQDGVFRVQIGKCHLEEEKKEEVTK